MATIISTAFIAKLCANLEKAFNDIGIASPKPIEPSGLTPDLLAEKFLQARSSGASSRSKSHCTVLPAKEVGRAWQLQASELIIANAQNAPWGWVDYNTLPLLDFWCDFEPDAKFVLVYVSPKFALASQKAASDGEKEDILALWRQYHAEILRFYTRNKDRAVLLNYEALKGDIGKLQTVLRAAFSLNLPTVPVTDLPYEVAPKLIELLAAAQAQNDTDATLLFEEMEALATLPDAVGNNNPPPDFSEAWEEYTELAENADGKAAFERLEQDFARIQGENELLLLQLSQVQEELENIFADKQKTLEELDAIRAELHNKSEFLSAVEKEKQNFDIMLEQKNELLSCADEEKELLTLQLMQVQEELEMLFLKQQQPNLTNARLQKNSAIELPLAAPKTQKSTFELDFRHFINGSGWHEAEHDGRWGAHKISTLLLPHMADGSYEMNIYIVGAMSRKMLTQMRLSCNGDNIPFHFKPRTDFKGVKGQAKRIVAQYADKYSLCPALISAKLDLKSQTTQKPTELKFEFPEVISPSDLGSEDYRGLTVRFANLSLRQA